MYLGIDCSTKAIHGVVVDDQENIIDQYVWTLGSEVSRSRNTELLKWYDDNVEYPETDCGGYRDQKCITITTLILCLLIFADL